MRKIAERVEDPHAEAVYAWENDFRDWSLRVCSLAECKEVMDTACAHYGVPPPKVALWKRRYSWCPDVRVPNPKRLLDQPVVRLCELGQNWPTVLHEAAHWIALHLAPKAYSHGPTWLGIYMWLLAQAKVAPEPALRASARSAGIKWAQRSPNWFKCKSE